MVFLLYIALVHIKIIIVIQAAVAVLNVVLLDHHHVSSPPVWLRVLGIGAIASWFLNCVFCCRGCCFRYTLYDCDKVLFARRVLERVLA